MSPPPDPAPPWAGVLLRAVLYALAIILLVLYVPGGEHVFIYQGF